MYVFKFYNWTAFDKIIDYFEIGCKTDTFLFDNTQIQMDIFII